MRYSLDVRTDTEINRRADAARFYGAASDAVRTAPFATLSAARAEARRLAREYMVVVTVLRDGRECDRVI